MKILKIALIMLVFLVNLIIARPAWADKPKVSKNPDYAQVTQSLDRLLQQKKTQDGTPELQQQIDELQVQKAAIESGVTWAQCRNETGRTLAIYGPASEDSDSDTDLYFLADGQTTPEGWDCKGVYLPSDIEAAGFESLPAVFAILDGTQLVARVNPDTSELVFNVPAVQGSGSEKLPVQNVSQAFIDSRIPSNLTSEVED